MFRYIPVVPYKTGGIAEINAENHNIEIIDQEDINGLVSKILFLLKNPDSSLELNERAYKYAFIRSNNSKVYDDILIAYKTIFGE